MDWFGSDSDPASSTGATEIGDYRWEGYSNAELADVLTQLGQGAGAEALDDSVQALRELAGALTETDRTLRTELGKLGIDWQSNAAEMASVIMSDSADYGDDASQRSQQSSDVVSEQGDVYNRARNSSPEPQTLRGSTQTGLLDNALGLLGHETDRAREVRQTNAARESAIDSMNQYTESTKQNLAGYRPLPEPPGIELNTAPSTGATTTQSIGSIGTSGSVPAPNAPGGAVGVAPVSGGATSYTVGGPSGGSFIVGGPAGGSVTGGPVAGGPVVGAPVTGGPVTGGPVTGGPVTGGPVTGGPGAGGATGGPVSGGPPAGGLGGGAKLPGPVTGLAPISGVGPVGSGGALGGVTGFRPDAGLAAGAIAAGAGVAGGATATPAREPRAPRGAATGSRGTATPLGNASPGQAAAARSAERIAGSSGRGGASMMQPATGPARGQSGTDDAEHVRKFGMESDDVFGDERMVAPSVFGDSEGERIGPANTEGSAE
ncbi:PPE family protein [Tamaricihabitans halophyticus]|uniref:PPE family protein n=1 Tax=Tamaricihabitans halophyticus TaxID=1262583 RepID=A0A4R2QVQ4_9PSEU|nr:hypothetical protein [Tamaricihabitans halophyticus]TCP54160.1 PPE family protein [Tamaricihabitans halophyticus]